MNQENDEPLVRETALTKGAMRGVEGVGSLGANPVPPAEPLADPVVYAKEPLFSKKVLIGWATATFILWFGATVILPEIVRSIKTGIEESIGNTPPGERIIETPNGKLTIIRTETGVTIETRRGRRQIDLPGPAAAPAPPATGAAGAPDAVPPLPPLDPTGKK